MRSHHWVELNNKSYSVTIRDDGNITISIEWFIPHPREAYMVSPTMIHRYASISPSGALGKKILKQLPKETTS